MRNFVLQFQAFLASDISRKLTKKTKILKYLLIAQIDLKHFQIFTHREYNFKHSVKIANIYAYSFLI